MNRPPPGHVRIIAGQWRGSKLPVAERPGLRPTSDRVRETVFNWLQNRVAGRRVLDLFAGTGALGFEAASRGAADVTLVERDPMLAESLRASAKRLHGDNLRVECADALAWLGEQEEGRYDLVFLDPPFASDHWAPVIAGLLPRLSETALIYVECPAAASPPLPANWQCLREGRTREVKYGLYLAENPDSAGTLAGNR